VLQARTTPFNPTSKATIFSAFAVRSNTDAVVQVELSSDRDRMYTLYIHILCLGTFR
jgi:hypothetical protein